LAVLRALADAADEVDRTAAMASFTAADGEAHRRAVARHDELRRQLDDVLEEARLLERDHRAEARRVAERLRAEEPSTAIADTLTGLSSLTAELASVLLGPPRQASTRGAAAAFRAGLG
ncbi:hypothetical protein, partial [Saccharothrix hoggarensis]